MASDENLIDFSEKSPRTTEPPLITFTNNPPITNNMAPATSSPSNFANIQQQTIHATALPIPVSKTGKSNKSLFEITRVEAHGESVGGDDSELDDTLSEAHSSTSVLESIAKDLDIEKTDSKIEKKGKLNIEVPSSKPLTIETSNTLATAITSASSTPSNHTPPVTQSADPPSRFRIVRITKANPYKKGKWDISEFQDPQKKDETISSENPASPLIKRTRGTTECGGDHKHDRTKTVTSPTEPRKTTSSESLMQTVLSTSQSRGSSFNTAFGDKPSSGESTSVTDTVVVPPTVKPVVSMFDNVVDQLQNVKEAMLHAFNEELRMLKDSVQHLQSENNLLKEENRKLRERLKIDGKSSDVG